MTSAGRDHPDDDARRYDDEATVIDPAVRRAIAAMMDPSEPPEQAPPEAVLIEPDPSDADAMIDRARAAASSEPTTTAPHPPPQDGPAPPGTPSGRPAQRSAGGCAKGCAVVVLVLVLLAVGSSLIAAVIGIAGVVIGGGSLAFMIAAPNEPTVAPTERSAPDLDDDEQPTPSDPTAPPGSQSDDGEPPAPGDAPRPDHDTAAPTPRP